MVWCGVGVVYVGMGVVVVGVGDWYVDGEY